jgi:enamine deaminase RidA (YjgF/YER057c/UK114 family)
VSDYKAVREFEGMGPSERLAALGVTVPQAPRPAAAYVGHVISGVHLYTAGQLPLVDGELLATGLVGDTVDLASAVRCARQCAINVLSQVTAAGRLMEDVRRFVKLTVFVASADGFTEQHLVANGASEFIGQVFGELGSHARSAVGVALLPLNSPVEIEAVIDVGSA